MIKRGFMEEIVYINEPLKEFGFYAEKHQYNTEDYLARLVRKSKLNIDENRAQAKKVDNLEKKLSSAFKSLKRWKIFKKVNIAFLIISLLFFAGSLAIAILNKYIASIICSVIFALLFITTILIHFLWIRKSLKSADQIHTKIKNEYNREKEIAQAQVLPLLSLFRPGMKVALFNKTLPFAKMDSYLSNERLAQLIEQYNFNVDTGNESMIQAMQSGSIYGNPYVFFKTLNHTMGTKTYTGSIQISWTTYSYSNGNRIANHHTQTLTASIDKPYPYFDDNYFMIFGSHACPDLSFTREPNSLHLMSEKELGKFVKKREKEIAKLKEKKPGFTPLANTKFEALFNALDRNNEHQYRMLFTPLAQQNISTLLLDSKEGYGDNFIYHKNARINLFKHEHLNNLSLNDELHQYVADYSYDVIKEKFINEQTEYFKKVYFALGPYFSIPIFQQTKTLDYIYRRVNDAQLNELEYECAISRMDDSIFKDPRVKTRQISKTQYLQQVNGNDNIVVHNFGYDIEERVEYVSKIGGDGKVHQIPVYWDEYIRYDNTSQTEVSVPRYEIEYGEDEEIVESETESKMMNVEQIKITDTIE
ncbi:hypothetical protein MCAL106L_0182 [Mycoplasmopsis californica]|nr:hypothetical protein MCAL106_0182 [Mycoplasmopsis californica]BBG41337.1 hypothetical protein MCAL106E_0182 [Mycoplasmopsis californica]BBG41930.1 hypothetical protein MCAL106L_0182 [Mycoplasmopsis californica]